MSTIIKEFTKEQLQQIIETDHVQCGEASALARIALASLEAEPVAYMVGTQLLENMTQAIAYKADTALQIKPLYTAPPAPVSVPAAMEMDDDFDSAFEHGKAVGWNAYRAAMLHGAEPVSQTCKLNEPSGNSPVIPDGWISCSERMPEKNQNVLISVNFDSSLVEPLICSARYTGSTFRRGEATIKPGNGIEQATHWMPLPEPPQEVNRG
ncbi:DUF551 domain-containing protein [Escherichia coli]|nr:DUF551 domain-containing protein [Escherichia coli]